jgi:hypothetical protein
MFISRLRTILQRRHGWLLWFALLMPVAQVAAGWHELSHLQPGPHADGAGKQALHLRLACDLCQSAAVVAGGAPLPQIAVPAAVAFVDELPHLLLRPARALPCAPVYHSRAPPLPLA